MKFKKPDTSYWDNKFAAYMHDPIDKVFQIHGHEERGAKQLEAFGQVSTPSLSDLFVALMQRQSATHGEV